MNHIPDCNFNAKEVKKFFFLLTEFDLYMIILIIFSFKSNSKSSQILDELVHSLKTKALIWKDICMLVFTAALFPILPW